MDPARLILPVLLLAGCTRDQTVYPSLAPRPVEKVSWAEPTAPATPAAVATDQALDGRIADQRTALANAGRRFAAADAHAAPLVAAAHGAAAGSERWVVAQTALADLDEARAATVDVGAALSQFGADRAATGEPDYPPLAAASADAAAQLRDETARIGALQTGLPTG